MSRCVRYLTHPQVRIDPAVPVPDWGLSDLGRRRTQIFAAADCLKATTRIVSSAERKAIETAERVAASHGIAVEIRAAMHENDRAATGFLPPHEFEATADLFFAQPGTSVRGWERALDAQARIVRELDAVLAVPAAGDILIVGHGGVGTLLYCHLAGLPIDRRYDQSAGGGCVFAFRAEDRVMIHPWRSIEDLW